MTMRQSDHESMAVPVPPQPDARSVNRARLLAEAIGLNTVSLSQSAERILDAARGIGGVGSGNDKLDAIAYAYSEIKRISVASVDLAAKCVAGEPSSHSWVDTPSEGPTAKRCSRCSRVTGQFYSLDDRRRGVDWLVATLKTCVLLWAQSLDTSAVRFSLLELDSSARPPAPEPQSDDTSQRFTMMELDL